NLRLRHPDSPVLSASLMRRRRPRAGGLLGEPGGHRLQALELVPHAHVHVTLSFCSVMVMDTPRTRSWLVSHSSSILSAGLPVAFATCILIMRSTVSASRSKRVFVVVVTYCVTEPRAVVNDVGLRLMEISPSTRRGGIGSPP